MATSYLSPGVFTREVDLSLYLANLSTTALGMVGLATKGPINEATLITNPVQFVQTFGDPDPNYMGPYAALQYLALGRQLYYVRTSESDINGYTAAAAALTLYESASPATLTGTLSNIMVFTSSNNGITFTVDGVTPAISYTISLGTATTVYKSVSEIVSLLNADATFATYLTASTSSSGTIIIKRNVSGSAHSVAISGSIISSGNVLGINTTYAVGTGTISEKSFIQGTGVTFPVAITEAPNPVLNKLRFDLGTDVENLSPINITLTAGAARTLDQLVAELNANATFNPKLVASSYLGQLRVQINPLAAEKYLALGVPAAPAEDAGTTVFGNINRRLTVTGTTTLTSTVISSSNNTLTFTLEDATTPTEVSITLTPATYATLADLYAHINTQLDALGTDPGEVGAEVTASNSGSNLVLTASGSAGYIGILLDTECSAAATLFGRTVQKHTSTTATSVLTVEATSTGTWGNNLAINIANVDAVAGTFDLNVYEKGFLVEIYQDLVKTPLTIPDPDDAALTIDNPKYVETAINDISSRITVTNPVGGGNLLLPLANLAGVKDKLTGGDDGEPAGNAINPSIYIGVSDNVQTTGLQIFRNPENTDINILAVPGVSSAEVVNEMIDICTTRKDCIALVDPPFAHNPQEVVDWRKGTGDWAGDHATFNSSYAALYWPWLEIYDSINKQKVWTPPSGHIAYIFANTDYNSETWFAPAGLNRGKLNVPLRAEYIPSLGERDFLYQNNVNPIATFTTDGLNVWGQKTLQTKTSALDRVNVRRLMLYLEKVVATATRQLLFEPADPVTWVSFVNLVEPFFDSIKARRGITDYLVRCDSTTNTADVIDRNEMRAIIFVKPTKAVEFIQIDFVITAAGANFAELSF